MDISKNQLRSTGGWDCPVKMEYYHFWPKNDGEKWCRKNVFETPCASHFLLIHGCFTAIHYGILCALIEITLRIPTS